MVVDKKPQDAAATASAASPNKASSARSTSPTKGGAAGTSKEATSSSKPAAKPTGKAAIKKPQAPPPLIPPVSAVKKSPLLAKKPAAPAAPAAVTPETTKAAAPTPEKPKPATVTPEKAKPAAVTPEKAKPPSAATPEKPKPTWAQEKAKPTWAQDKAKPATTQDKAKPTASKGAVEEKTRKETKKEEDKKTATPETTAGDEENAQKKKKRIVIPFVLPWESRPALQNQSGMGAFGTKIDVFKPKGGKALPLDAPLRSETILTLFAETNKFSSQTGMHAFGQHRHNVIRLENAGKDIDEGKLRLCRLVIPKQSGTNEAPTQSGQTPIGSLRQQIMKIEYRPDMKEKMEKKSEAILTRFGTPNPNCHAGTAVIDKFRKQVPDIAVGAKMKKGHDRRTEAVLPKFAQMKHLPTPAPITGAGVTGLGPFRQVITPVTGGYQFTTDEIVASKKVVPWTSMGILASQQGTGGFQTRRDVVSHVTEAMRSQVK